jgi:hypothetical protein
MNYWSVYQMIIHTACLSAVSYCHTYHSIILAVFTVTPAGKPVLRAVDGFAFAQSQGRAVSYVQTFGRLVFGGGVDVGKIVAQTHRLEAQESRFSCDSHSLIHSAC